MGSYFRFKIKMISCSICLSLYHFTSYNALFVTNGWISFFLAEEHFSVYHIFFNCSSVDVHFGCFQVLAIMTNVAVNMGVQLSFEDSGFSSFG